MSSNLLEDARKSFEDAQELVRNENLDEAYDLYVDGINKSEQLLTAVANGNEELMKVLLERHEWLGAARKQLAQLTRWIAERNERARVEEERREKEEELRRSANRAKKEKEEEQRGLRDKLASLREEVHSHAESRVVTIAYGSTGHGYGTMFGPCIDNELRLMLVEEPFITHDYQYFNFLNLVETVVGKASALKEIYLCKRDMKPTFDLEKALDTLEKSLAKRDISFKVLDMNKQLHDRFIRFDNGWTIMLGKGLHYFDRQTRFDLGAHNTNLRSCFETTISFTKKSLRHRNASSSTGPRRRCDYWPRNCEHGAACNFIHPDKPCPHRVCHYTAGKCQRVHLCSETAPCSLDTCTFYNAEQGLTVVIQDEDLRERINSRHPGVAIGTAE